METKYAASVASCIICPTQKLCSNHIPSQPAFIFSLSSTLFTQQLIKSTLLNYAPWKVSPLTSWRNRFLFYKQFFPLQKLTEKLIYAMNPFELRKKKPPQRRAAKKCPLCMLTSRLINTWSENHLPWLPPSERSAAISSSSSSSGASQWERTKLAFVGHVNCIPLTQNVAAPGVASGKVCEWCGITAGKKKFHSQPPSFSPCSSRFFVSRVVGAWQDAKSWSKAAQTKRRLGTKGVVVVFIWIFILVCVPPPFINM